MIKKLKIIQNYLLKLRKNNNKNMKDFCLKNILIKFIYIKTIKNIK